MIMMNRKLSFVFLLLVLNTVAGCAKDKLENNVIAKKPNVQIILGSTREGRSSDKIAQVVQAIALQRNDVNSEIIDLRDYALPFLNDATPPAMRTVITHPLVKRWSDKISQADAFIIVLPSYNSGYPGVLKNALDSLYKEWNNKPVGFVGYSGGPLGGADAIAQLQEVTRGLNMQPVLPTVHIPYAWKAFDEDGKLVTPIDDLVNRMIDGLIKKNS